MRTVMNVLLWAAAIYCAVVALAYFAQSRLVFYPNLMGRALSSDPTHIGLAFEDVNVTTEDGLSIHGWFIPADAPRGTVLFCHGNAGNIAHRLDSIQIFHQLRLNVLIFDYRGYGLSEGTPGEAGTYLDARAMWSHLTQERGVAPGDVILFGRSLGGAVAAELATRTTPGALVVESAFTSVPDLASKHYWFLPVRWLSRILYPTESFLSQVTVPTLIVHSREDEIVPFEHGQALYRAAGERKSMLEIRGNHNDGFVLSREAYTQGLDGFIDRHMGH